MSNALDRIGLMLQFAGNVLWWYGPRDWGNALNAAGYELRLRAGEMRGVPRPRDPGAGRG